MSLKSSALKLAIQLTPNVLIIWISNIVLKGIAELTQFHFDVDSRKLFVQTRLYGEDQTIDVCLENFAIFHDGNGYRIIIHHASSDRPWLNNILHHIIGKGWPIPAIPQLSMAIDIVAELFKAQPVALESVNSQDEQ